ncbi:N-acetyltransferase [Rhizobium sp. TH2]|nr:GNAT family N-acetyltransferase [Rhizobium sp. TH2]UVC11879.1 N-acetyltransferase [Rhizobium sp. TH2]
MLNIRIVSSFREIDPESWNRLSGTSHTKLDNYYNPFISHAYLSALEESGSAVPRTGWQGRHVLVEEDGRLKAATFGYAKSHSQGEYVFDHGWADAYERAGGRYYPKLQHTVPFTPATGPRLLVARDESKAKYNAILALAVKQETVSLNLSSAHFTFLRDGEWQALEAEGYLHRTDQQFHFLNHGYGSHDDFLETLASRKRKALRKERRAALENGITVEWLTGSDLTEDIWDQFFAFYMDTGGRKWGRPYLTREFYSLIGERMPEDILLVMAKRNGRYIAGAINFIGSDALFGRHWGCIEDHPFLHFEICYHQAIDYAIANKLDRVEAGAQGEHKLARGYMPVITHSAHFIAHAGLRRAIDEYLRQERADVEAVGEYLREHSPFRRGEQLEQD